MIKKGHALALAVTTAGLIGFGAPLASAATMPHHPTSILNVSNNQVPVQACGNDLNTGAGSQTPVNGAAFVGSLLSPGAKANSASATNRGCEMKNSQHGGSNASGVFNVANNQLPTQVCGNQANTGGGTQAPLNALAGNLAFLSPFSMSNAVAVTNQGCQLSNSQHG